MTNQQQRVLTHLQSKGSINPLESLMDLSVYRLSDVIYVLRTKYDYDIQTNMTKSLNRFKEKVSYATYVYKGVKDGN